MAECLICQDVLSDPTEDTCALACGHMYHAVCIRKFVEVSRVAMAALKCPTCRLSADDLQSAELQLQTVAAPDDDVLLSDIEASVFRFAILL
jgi:hypothetical protein